MKVLTRACLQHTYSCLYNINIRKSRAALQINFKIGIYQNFWALERHWKGGTCIYCNMSRDCYSRLEFDRPSCRRFKQCLQEISRNSNFGFSENGVGFLPQVSPKKVHHVTPVGVDNLYPLLYIRRMLSNLSIRSALKFYIF